MIAVRYFLDQAMQTEAFEQARNLAAVEMGQEPAQRLVLQAADVELTAEDGLKQGVVIGVKEVEARIGAAFFCNGLRKLVESSRVERNSR